MIAIQPPAYFPSLAHTALLQHVEHFILADTFPYRRKTFQNRSKLRNAPGGHWIRIPVFGRPEGAPIHTVDIETGGRWREKHWRSFKYDYRSTMYFEYFAERFRTFYAQEWTELANCTCRSVELQAELFGLSTALSRASMLDGAPNTYAGIAAAVEGDVLVVPEEGTVDGSDVDRSRVEVQSFAYDHPTYRQNFEGFEPGMTALDLAFNYGREAVRILAGGVRTANTS
ncbi:MAG: hypothetical protein BRD55_09390 [Bacteroidetes bacterium SW_9_63_38]|nr:MAG: hypothetical protein BRD55_09390 [Bacteroidetes bacterium SW_9_63_38]